jgi:hypothetical protein
MFKAMPTMHTSLKAMVLLCSLCGFTRLQMVGDSLTVTRVPRPPAPVTFIVGQNSQDTGGNTRFRYYPPELRDVSLVGFDAAVRADLGAHREYPNAHCYRWRDRDLGQVFTVPASAPIPLYLEAVTLRVGPTAEANTART